MTRHAAEIVPPRPRERRLFGRRPTSLELHGVSVQSANHYTRPWPGPVSGPDALFRFAVLPVRLLALGVLWATCSPTRVLVTAVILGAVLAL